MITLLRRRDFSLLWFGSLLSTSVDYLLFIALPFFVYDRTGSVLATGATFLAQTLPGAVLGTFAGVFVDRWDRRRTMVACDLLRAAVLLPLVLVAFGGPLWLVFVVVVAESAVSAFFLPARDAIIPSLVGESHLASANSLKALSEGVPSFIGPLIGVALLGLIGFGGLILVDIRLGGRDLVHHGPALHNAG